MIWDWPVGSTGCHCPNLSALHGGFLKVAHITKLEIETHRLNHAHCNNCFMCWREKNVTMKGLIHFTSLHLLHIFRRLVMSLHCAVVGCSNGSYKLEKWKSQMCPLHSCHKGCNNCICDPPFRYAMNWWKQYSVCYINHVQSRSSIQCHYLNCQLWFGLFCGSDCSADTIKSLIQALCSVPTFPSLVQIIIYMKMILYFACISQQQIYLRIFLFLIYYFITSELDVTQFSCTQSS